MNNESSTNVKPSALMLLSSHCAHCPGVLDSLTKMIKAGDIESLKVINLELNPEAMQQYKVRSVPWVRIGKHELTGAQTLEALKQRVDWAIKDQQSNTNLVADFDFLLSDGQVNKVIEALQEDGTGFEAIMTLLGDTGTVLSTRIGIGVVFEEFAGKPILKKLITQLGELIHHDDIRIRQDALHYLGMTADKSAIPLLETAVDDPDEEIREIVSDSLENLRESLQKNSIS